MATRPTIRPVDRKKWAPDCWVTETGSVITYRALVYAGASDAAIDGVTLLTQLLHLTQVRALVTLWQDRPTD